MLQVFQRKFFLIYGSSFLKLTYVINEVSIIRGSWNWNWKSFKPIFYFNVWRLKFFQTTNPYFVWVLRSLALSNCLLVMFFFPDLRSCVNEPCSLLSRSGWFFFFRFSGKVIKFCSLQLSESMKICLIFLMFHIWLHRLFLFVRWAIIVSKCSSE